MQITQIIRSIQKIKSNLHNTPLIQRATHQPQTKIIKKCNDSANNQLIKIALFTTPEGHASIAEAILENLTDCQYQVFQYYYEDPLFDLYRLFYIHRPKLFSTIYKISNHQATEQLSRFVIGFHKIYRTDVEEFINRHNPDCLISTHFSYNSTLTQISLQRKIPFFNIVANPRTFINLEIASPPGLNLVFDQFQKEQVSIAKPQALIKQVGWFVRKRYRAISCQEKNTIRQKLSIDPQSPSVFIATGSEGTQSVWQVIESLTNIQTPLTMIFATGNNHKLAKKAHQLKKRLIKSNPLIKLIVLPFGDIADHFKTSDLVVGKAGPNTIFEATACHIPFFAITHIAGHEDGNLDILNKNQLGWVEENPIKAVVKITNLIYQPKLRQEKLPWLIRQASINDQAFEKLLTAIKQVTKTNKLKNITNQ